MHIEHLIKWIYHYAEINHREYLGLEDLKRIYACAKSYPTDNPPSIVKVKRRK